MPSVCEPDGVSSGTVQFGTRTAANVNVSSFLFVTTHNKPEDFNVTATRARAHTLGLVLAR